MKKIIHVLIFCFAFSPVFSQNTFHHECAVDASPLLRSANGFTLMYRYHGSKYSLRALGNIYYENTTNGMNNDVTTPAGVNGTSYTHSEASVFNGECRLGLQRNLSFETWGFYAGVDGIFAVSYRQTNSETRNPGQFGDSRYMDNSTVQSLSYGIAPFIGIRYKVNERFLISLENGFAFTYSQNSSDQRADNYFTPVKGTEYLNNTNTLVSGGGSTKLDYSPSKYLRLFVGFRF